MDSGKPASLRNTRPFSALASRLWLLSYRLLWQLVSPFVWIYLLKRSIRQPEYRRHWPERIGIYPSSLKPPNKAFWIWIHAVSLGETRAAQSLIKALRKRWPKAGILLTHGTPTGRQAGKDMADAQVYLPYEWSGAIHRFLSFWKPSIGLVMETEIWPLLTHLACREQVPMLLVNGRLSEKSFRKAQTYSPLIRPALEGFDAFLMQAQADASRLSALSDLLGPIHVTGNLKFDLELDAILLAQGLRWRKMLIQAHASCRVIVAASTRETEEDIVLAAWKALIATKKSDQVLFVIVPRHPQRFDEVAASISSYGFQICRRSSPDFESIWQGPRQSMSELVVLGDSLGEMASWYSLADVVIMGGSLAGTGSQNLIEPCSASCPVVLGPSIYNFEQAAMEALDAGAAVQTEATRAVETALSIIADPQRQQAMANAASGFSQAHQGASEKSVARLAPLLNAFSDA
jgi:3-deoxy-D-manno-octulosonic-acid transferase